MKQLKPLRSILTISICLILLTACGSREHAEKADNKLGKMEVVIPDELKDNPEIVEYIEGLSGIVDEYALLMDEMISELDGIEGSDWEGLNIGQQLKVTTTAAKFAMKSAPITARWGEFEARRALNNDELTQEELKALESVLERFERRMEQIEEKNKEFFQKAEG